MAQHDTEGDKDEDISVLVPCHTYFRKSEEVVQQPIAVRSPFRTSKRRC